MRGDTVLAEGQIYHVFSKSISEFRIFNNEFEFERMIDVIKFYQQNDRLESYCRFKESKKKQNDLMDNSLSNSVINIIAFCLMPTHLHLVLKQKEKNNISIFMNKILNSYTRYFNLKHNRKGPLWQSRFKRLMVKNDEQLLHLTRYVHLNPTTAYLVNQPQDWEYSSYKEYLDKASCKIANFQECISIDPISYKFFVEDRLDYQRNLSAIKHLILED